MNVAPNPVTIMQGEIPEEYQLIRRSHLSRSLKPKYSQNELQKASNKRSTTNDGRIVEAKGIRSTRAAGLSATTGAGRLGPSTSWPGLSTRTDIIALDDTLGLLVSVKGSAIKLSRGL